MNRRQFIAGLMASTVAPAPLVPILKPRSIGMSASSAAYIWGRTAFPVILSPVLYEHLKACSDISWHPGDFVPWQRIPETT